MILKRRFFQIMYIFTALVMIINVIFIIRDSVNFSMENLPEGEKLYSLDSPSGDKTLTVYYVNNSFGTAIRANIEDLQGKRNIYWQTGIEGVNSGWINDMVVDINGIELNVEAGADYDCRRGYSIFSEGSIEGENIEGALNME